MLDLEPFHDLFALICCKVSERLWSYKKFKILMFNGDKASLNLAFFSTDTPAKDILRKNKKSKKFDICFNVFFEHQCH